MNNNSSLLFTHIPHEQVKRPFIEMIDDPRGHFYKTESGAIFPSITTMIKTFTKDGIDIWRNKVGWENADRISKESTDVGTTLHSLIEQFLNNEEPKLNDEQLLIQYAVPPWVLFDVVKPALADINNIHATEMKLFSDEMGLAGTVDCVAEYEGVLSIIDFKNSRKKKTKSRVKNYAIQTAAYSQMWRECIGDDIKQGVVIIANWDFTTSIFKFKIDEYMKDLWSMLVSYNEINS